MATDEEAARLKQAVAEKYGKVIEEVWKEDLLVENILDRNAYYIEFGPGPQDYCHALSPLKGGHVQVFDNGEEIIQGFQGLLGLRHRFIAQLGGFSLVDLIGAVIALAITGIFIVLSITRAELNRDFLGIFALIAGYYFGKTR